jgi:hypothetical protein
MKIVNNTDRVHVISSETNIVSTIVIVYRPYHVVCNFFLLTS